MTKRLEKKPITVARTPLKYAALASLFLVAYIGEAPIIANAQTDFDIKSDSRDLKSEFQKELDKWMLRSYEGDRDAQFKVGVLFANDQFGPPDYEQAAYWYRQAARQGHPLAQYNLGHQFLTGNGVKRDEEAAMQWWLKAAEQEHAIAQFNVGRAYYLGIGLKKDLNQSRLWFERASQNNEPKSTELLKQLGWWESEEPASVVTTSIDSTSTLRSKIEPVKPLPNQNETSSETEVATADTESTDTVSSSTSETANEADTLASDVIVSTDTSRDDEANREDSTEDNAEDTSSKAAVKATLALFTNPAIRSVLITLYNNPKNLKIIDKGPRWTTVSAADGFPVWVHSNFLKVNEDVGVVTATSVNARSVPLITQGSVVGRLDRGDTVTVLDKRGDWYRLHSPSRFKAWAKTEELEGYLAAVDQSEEPVVSNDSSSSEPDTIEPETETVTSTTDAQTSSDTLVSITASTTNTNNDAQTTQSASKKINIKDNASLLDLGLPLDDNNWLFSQPETNYTLQLASFSETEPMVRYVSSLPFKQSDQFHLFHTKSSNGTEWVYATYGSFADRDLAKAETERLGQSRAWIRKLGILQEKRCLGWKKQVPAPKELNKYCK